MTEKSYIKTVSENLAEIEKNITDAASSVGKKREDVILLAATKTVSPEIINHAINSGVKYIGENRVQEFLSKENEIQTNVCRHFIGHLQTNKAKDIVGRVAMIESVHSLKLANLIGKLSCDLGIETDILLEVNIGKEENKSGFIKEELDEIIPQIAKIEGVNLRGLMTIPPVCEKKTEIIPYNVSMEYLSMGMSSDYAEAIKCGSNLVRVGTSLFGKRNYK